MVAVMVVMVMVVMTGATAHTRLRPRVGRGVGCEAKLG